MAERYGLIADVGGTNIRLALLDLTSGARLHTQKYLCADYPTIVDVIQRYLADVDAPDIKDGCLAIACPTDNDWIAMTNHSWQFSVRDTKAALGFEQLHFINDFTAIAQSLPELSADKVLKIGGGELLPEQPKVVLGAGTGLGVAHLVHHQQQWLSLPGEGGHADFAPLTERQVALWQVLTARFDHLSWEQLLSGMGLQNIYSGLCEIDGEPAEALSPAEICERALSEKSLFCQETLAMFCEIMGALAGNLALTMSTFGGVYIAGGIVPRFPEYFAKSNFRMRFEDKGRFAKYNARIPTYLVQEEQPGLVGCGAYLRQVLGL